MARRAQALVVGFTDEDQQTEICDRLWEVGFRGFPARDGAHATDLIGREGPFQVAVVFSRTEDLGLTVGALRAAVSVSNMRILLLGPRLGVRQIDDAKEAGATLGLWEPFHNSELRFVVNQAAFDDTRGDVRDQLHQLRVPTQLAAFVHSGAGRKPAGVYNLSLHGAYLETPRPNGTGATIRVELLMRDGSVEVEAEVVTTNVPGNLRKANRPIGMGVRFTGVGPGEEESIAKYIHMRTGLYVL